MKRRKAKAQSRRQRGTFAKRVRWTVAVLLAVAAVAVGLAWHYRSGTRADAFHPRRRGELTFTRDIAPVIFQNCSECHRPGQAAPFSLLTYADVKKHASDIADVTSRRYMPPWLPEYVPGQFTDVRRLSADQIGVIRQWVAEGAVEGRASDLPPAPQWSSDWQLGPPDMVVTMPEPYILPADGRDVYRNFILPVPLKTPRYIRAMELHPSSKVVHHAFMRFDRTQQCRVLDAQDPGPGFGGMETPRTAETPPGNFSGWVPGARPARAPDGLAWQFPAGADFVLLLHMQPSGKPERIQPSIGLYFTDAPPTNTPAIVNLETYSIDIPAGATDYAVEETMTLPVDTDLLAVKPHAHYLGKRLEGIATLPDGTSRTLLSIPQWDFNWQTDYRYQTPVSVPAGTVLRLRYTYDNSTNNARNPHRPPERVKYGLQSSDEMAELAFQMLARRKEDLPRLQAAAQQYAYNALIRLNEHQLQENPTNAEAMAEVGKLVYGQRRVAEAESLLRRSLELRPASADAHYSLGIVFMDASKLPEAEAEFVEALRLDPGHYKARNNAGLCCLREGKLDDAARHFSEVLRWRPDDPVARGNLDLVLQARRGKQ